MLSSQIGTATAGRVASPIDFLNEVRLTGAQVQAALERLAWLPAHLRDRPAAQALALQAFAEEEGFAAGHASAALHARATALAKWTAAHDPGRQSNAEAVIEAAARFPLSESETGVAFEPSGFQEMVLFIEDLPW